MHTDINAYIPQRPPFVMIDTVISADESHTQTSFTIREDNIFITNGCFSESGMIENLAQTAGAGVGFRRLRDGLPQQSGYIAALKNVSVRALPKVNETITARITFEQILLSFHIVKGTITVNGNEIASCEFKIFVNNQPA